MRAGTTIAVVATLALAGCAVTDPLNNDVGGIGYRSVVIGSPDASAFLYVPADRWTALGPDDGARQAAMLGDHSFSPVKANSPVRMTIGIRYVVIPVCAGQPRWDKAIRPVIEDQKAVTVGC
ncbi:MAG TPA: hypothetical protein VF459_18055 [Caulobacteraceae bacterium]